MCGQLLAHDPGLHPLRDHVGRAGRETELPQVVIGCLLYREHPANQPAKLDRVVNVSDDDRLGSPGPHHPGQLERALLVTPPVAPVLEHQIESETLPAAQDRDGGQRGKRVDLERGQRPGPHDLLHRVRHRHHAKVELQRLEGRHPGSELVQELDGLVGMRANQRLPRARVRDADREVQAGRDPTEGHLTGDTHRLVAQSNIQSH
jgi:hypothetical protein